MVLLFRLRQSLPLTLVLLAVCAAYSNHFQNGFHFDDSHAVVDNPYIRSLHNLPRFFRDATTFSVLPANRTYRPIVSASLAIDYALGHGYKPFWFQLSTFLVFLAQLVFMYLLYLAILRAVTSANRASSQHAIALLAVAWYGVHPAMAETVNYIIQRGDVFCAFGVVAALAIYARWPGLRKTGVYLLPLAFALLSKPPAIVFPALLFLYIVFFEDLRPGRVLRALRACIPALLVCAALIALQAAMTPKSYAPSMLSAAAYRITQPYVLLRYFGSLFLPLHLNVDTDLPAFASVNGQVLLGFLFLALLLAAAWFTARRHITRPISFGLLWFVVASLPTSLFVLSEVENDHRMFLPFVGLVLAVVWTIALALNALAERTGSRQRVAQAALLASLILLALYGYGTILRNRVWHSDESLWLDDVQKCPHNGRGLMNYGLTQMAKGAYPVALDYFTRALQYTPNYPTLEINLGIVYGALHQAQLARQHFERAISLAPADNQTHFFYGRWLFLNGDIADAVHQLQLAALLNPSRLATRDLLASAYAAEGNTAQARATALDTLRIAPSDAGAAHILTQPVTPNADFWINLSLRQYQLRNYPACIAAAQQALRLRPNSAEAYNNIAAANAAMGNWDNAIAAARKAIALKPDFQLAKNNLAWAESQKKLHPR